MIRIPENMAEAQDRLTTLEGIATATGWERAAIVYAFTRDDLVVKGDQKISFREFAKLGIAGLSSHNTVARYHDAWKLAVEQHDAPEVEPGGQVELPTAEWPPEYKYLGKIRDEELRERVHAAAEEAGVSPNIVAYVRENPGAIAAAVRADEKIAKAAADALAETPKGRITAYDSFEELDKKRLADRGSEPVPRSEKPLEWMVTLRKAVDLAEDAVPLIAPYDFDDSQREFITLCAKRLVAAGEWLLSGEQHEMSDESLHQWIDGERNA